MNERPGLRVTSAALAFLLAFFLVTALLPGRNAQGAAPGPGPSPVVEPRGSVELQPPEGLPVVRDAAVEAEANPEDADPSPAHAENVGRSSAGTVLYGVITDLAGTALDEAGVWIQSRDGSRTSAPTDAQGRYTLGPIAPGEWTVHAGKMFFHDEDVRLSLAPELPLLRQDFALRPEQVIWVRLVTSDGTPFFDAFKESGLPRRGMNLVPVATREDPGATFTGVRGSLNNQFGIGSYWQSQGWGFRESREAPYIGSVTLHEDGPAWLSLVVAHQVLRKRPVDPSVEEVTFVVDLDDIRSLTGGLRATLVDGETGQPLAGKVWLHDDPFPMGQTFDVGADGHVEFVDVMPGDRWFVVRAEGRAGHVQRVSLLPGQALELGDVPLHPPVALRGHVRTAAGDPVEAVLNWGRVEPGGDVAWARQVATKSKPDGSFAIENLVPGTWVIRCPGLPARPPQGSDGRMASLPLRVDATQGSVDGLEVVVLDTTTVTLVTDGVQDPWPRAEAFDAQGLPAASAWPGRYGNETTMPLVPGTYELVIERDGVELERRTLVVGTEPQRLELAFD